jgi:hypothetical protein
MPPLMFSALPAPLIDQARADALAAGSAVRQDDDDDTFPVRCCLSDARAGEGVLLLSLQPPCETSPYTAASPVYVHAGACAGHRPSGEVPEILRHRRLSLRGYDSYHMITGSTVVEGQEVEQAAGELFANQATEYVFVHFAGPGCYACRIDRAA